MAFTLSKSGITTGNTIQTFHVTQSIDALTGEQAYDIKISGSLELTGSVKSQNGFIGNITGTSSYSENATLSNTVKLSNIVTTSSYTVPYISSTASAVNLYYSSTGPKYNPVTETLTVKNIQGTASIATKVEIIPSQSVILGDVYPSGSTVLTNSSLKLITGASKTGNVPKTVDINIPVLVGKTLGQTCFITTGISGSLGSSNVVVVNGLVGTTLTFESMIPNTDFYFTIIYI